MQPHVANGTRLACLQIENRGIHHGHERLGNVVRERAKAGPETRRQDKHIQGIRFHPD